MVFAQVPWPEATASRSPVQAAQQELRQAWEAMQTLGILADLRREAEKALAFYKGLANLAKPYAKAGLRTAEEIAQRVGVQMSAVVRAAWDDAVPG